MRPNRVFITTLALVLALLMPSQVAAAPVGPQSDMVVGGGKTATDILNITAHMGPNGKLTGKLDAKNTPGTDDWIVKGDVLCLNVIGNRASIGGILTDFSAPGWPPTMKGWLMFVEDNGNQQDVLDKISYQYIYANPVTTCPNPTATSAFFELVQGNLNVVKGN